MKNKTYEEYLNEIKRGSYMLKLIPVEMQTDEVIDIAMDDDACVLVDIKDESKKTVERCLKSVKKDWKMFRYIPADMQTDEVIKTAMNGDKVAFRWIKNDNMKTIKRCLEAVGIYSWLIENVPEKLKDRVKEELGLS